MSENVSIVFWMLLDCSGEEVSAKCILYIYEIIKLQGRSWISSIISVSQSFQNNLIIRQSVALTYLSTVQTLYSD